MTKKELNGEEEKDKNEDILLLGETILESANLLTESNLFSISDQESTSGDEEILGMSFYYYLFGVPQFYVFLKLFRWGRNW